MCISKTNNSILTGSVCVRTEGLRKSYPLGNAAVNALDMRGRGLIVQRGEFLSIMGPSGSGKSTLLHILGGIDRPDSGKLWIEEECLSEMSESQLTLFRRERIGVVFQFFNLLPALTVEENISLPLWIAGTESNGSGRIEELLKKLELSDRRLHTPAQLSGGEQQRVAIARAFVSDPSIILMDEPTGNLDSRTGTRILELLAEMHHAYHKTIVMVTHNPAAAAYSQRTVFLRDGAISDELKRVATHGKARRLSTKTIDDCVGSG